MLTRKDFETFLTNEVAMTATKSTPFDFQKIINQIAVNYGSVYKDNEPIVQAFLTIWQVPDGWLHLEKYFETTLRKGLVKRISFEGKELFMLTEKGETLQDLGSLAEYEKNARWKKRIENAKEVVTYFITPLIAFLAVISTFFPFFKKDKPLEIKQPIILHIDNLKENHLNTSSKHHEQTKPIHDTGKNR